MVPTAGSPQITTPPRSAGRMPQAEIFVSVCLDCGTPIPARLIELARADLMILTDRPLRYGTTVQLALFGDLVTAVTQNRGIVHWCRPHQMGWQIGVFLTMPLPDRLTEREWSDLRNSLRYECNWKAWILWDGDGRLEPVWISNYYVGGLCMNTNRIVTPGSKFSLFGAGGGKGSAVLSGEVQWARENDTGVAVGCLVHGLRGRDLPRLFGNLDAVHVDGSVDLPLRATEDSLETRHCELASCEKFLPEALHQSSHEDEYAFAEHDSYVKS